MSSKFEVPDFGKFRDEVLRVARVVGGTESVKFFKESFRKGGFTDSSFQKWSQSNNPFRHGNKTLYSVGTLFNSIHKFEQGNKIVVESNTRYSDIHNNGGTITVTKAMKAHFWREYYELTGAGNRKKKGASKTRISAKAAMCKRIALMPVGAKIKIPKRQFMGHSQVMMKTVEDVFSNVVNRKFGNIDAK